jgi:hypothetical protein
MYEKSKLCKPCDKERRKKAHAKAAALAEAKARFAEKAAQVAAEKAAAASAAAAAAAASGAAAASAAAEATEATGAQVPAYDARMAIEMSRLRRRFAELSAAHKALTAHAEGLSARLEQQEALASAMDALAAKNAAAGGAAGGAAAGAAAGAVSPGFTATWTLESGSPLETVWGLHTSPGKAQKPRMAKRVGAFVALASDWHVEETVTLEQTSGVNEYNLDIADARIADFGRGIAEMWDYHSYAYDLDKLVLGVVGDLFTGSIHPENVETASMSPIETVAWLNDRLVRVVSDILADCSLSKPGSLVIPFSWGNHGRTTKRTHISTNAQNNYEFLIADTVRRAFAKDPRVQVLAPRANHTYVDLWGEKSLRFTHLDSVKYQGGIGGLTVPLNKAVIGWNNARYADVTCGGHWHQYLPLPNAVVNGSLIGYNPYAEWIRASPEKPQQASFVVDKKHGKCLDAPIWVG